MTRRCFIDMVSSAAPAYKGEYQTSPVRLAIAVENDADEIVATLLRRIIQINGTRYDGAWCVKYGVPYGSVGDAMESEVVAGMVLPIFEGAWQAVAHASAFHQRQFERLMSLGKVQAQPMPWICTMAGATSHCKIPARTTRGYKQPTLAEAVQHFTGEPLAPVDGMTWQHAALRTLDAVRRVQWGIEGRGIPPAIVETEGVGA